MLRPSGRNNFPCARTLSWFTCSLGNFEAVKDTRYCTVESCRHSGESVNTLCLTQKVRITGREEGVIGRGACKGPGESSRNSLGNSDVEAHCNTPNATGEAFLMLFDNRCCSGCLYRYCSVWGDR